MAEEKVRLIGRLRVPLIKLAFGSIEKWLIDKIKFAPLREELKANIDLLAETADKLTDKDPDNIGQLKKVWEKYKEESTASVLRLVKSGIRKLVKDERDADFLIAMLEGILQAENEDEQRAARVSASAPTTA